MLFNERRVVILFMCCAALILADTLSPPSAPSPISYTARRASLSTVSDGPYSSHNRSGSGFLLRTSVGSSSPAPALSGFYVPTTLGAESLLLHHVLSSGGVVVENGQTLGPLGSTTVYNLPSSSLVPSQSVSGAGRTTTLESTALVTSTSHVVVSPASQLSTTHYASSSNLVLVGGETLSFGVVPTASGTSYALLLAETVTAMGQPTNPVPPASVMLETSPPATITIGTIVVPAPYAPSSSGNLLGNGRTLGPGSTTTMSGIVYSLMPSESALIISRPTYDLTTATTAASASTASAASATTSTKTTPATTAAASIPTSTAAAVAVANASVSTADSRPAATGSLAAVSSLESQRSSATGGGLSTRTSLALPSVRLITPSTNVVASAASGRTSGNARPASTSGDATVPRLSRELMLSCLCAVWTIVGPLAV